MRALLVLFALAVLGLRAEAAELIIYKGSARALLPSTTSQYSSAPRVYLIVDLASKESVFLFYFTLKGQKKYQNFFPIANTRYSSQFISATQRIGTFSAIQDSSVGSDFTFQMMYFRGVEKSLLLGLVIPKTGNHPKTMTGLYRLPSSSGVVGLNFEFNFSLSYDAASTQLGNDTNKTMQQMNDILVAQLIQKGYH